MIYRSDLYDTDPAKRLITIGWDLDDLNRDLSGVWNVWVQMWTPYRGTAQQQRRDNTVLQIVLLLIQLTPLAQLAQRWARLRLDPFQCNSSCAEPQIGRSIGEAVGNGAACNTTSINIYYALFLLPSSANFLHGLCSRYTDSCATWSPRHKS